MKLIIYLFDFQSCNYAMCNRIYQKGLSCTDANFAMQETLLTLVVSHFCVLMSKRSLIPLLNQLYTMGIN